MAARKKARRKSELRQGRAPTYTKALAKRICERLAAGESLLSICRDPKIPVTDMAVRKWETQDYHGFRSEYAEARDKGLDVLAEDTLGIADGDGDVQRDRLRVDTRKWYVSKLAPKRYGDRLALDHTGEVKTSATDADVARKVALLLAKATARQVRAETTTTSGNGRN